MTLLLVVQAWCKPSNTVEDLDYNGDVPIDDEEDTLQNEDDSEPPDAKIPPQITSDPKKVHVRAGTTVTLPCHTTNADYLTVVWKKDDVFLYTDDNPLTLDKDRIVRTPENSLVIYNTTVNDSSDNYTCTIVSKNPITITHSVLVEPKDWSPMTTTMIPTVTSPLPTSKGIDTNALPLERIEADQGQDVKLVCSLNGQPMKKLQWYYEGNQIYNDQKRSMHGNNLIIRKVNRHDAGRYMCLINNVMHVPPYATFQLIVNYAPEIKVEREIVHTGIGGESEMTCIVHAHPQANVYWYKNQKEVPKKGKFSQHKNESVYTLNIMHTSEDDLGDYSCVARNGLGQASKTISLTGVPTQASVYGIVVTKDDNGFILKWRLQSYSPITEYKLKYRLKGNENWVEMEPLVTDGEGSQYTVEHAIEGLQPGSYEAILVARNSFGWSPPSTPYTFVRDHRTEEAADIKTGSAVSIRPFWTIPISLLVVCAFRNL